MVHPLARKCPSCGALLRADALPERMIRCAACRAVVTMPERWRMAPAVSSPMNCPPRLLCEPMVGGVEIRQRWRTVALFGWVPCCLAASCLVVFWLYTELASRYTDWVLVMLLTGDVALVFALVWWTLARLANTTVIRVGRSELSVRHRPFWWPGNLKLDARRIRQVFSRASVSSSRRSTAIYHTLCAVLDDGSTQELLGTGSAAEEVQYLEQEIQRALGLKERLGGELRRD